MIISGRTPPAERMNMPSTVTTEEALNALSECLSLYRMDSVFKSVRSCSFFVSLLFSLQSIAPVNEFVFQFVFVIYASARRATCLDGCVCVLLCVCLSVCPCRLSECLCSDPRLCPCRWSLCISRGQLGLELCSYAN